ncbi:MAG: hypothetical protein IKL13_02095 [Clostridia bacterium]|nr:hypothetical protein [Clostridia bacterium]
MKENKKMQELKLNGVAFDEGMDIFGEHKTKEQVRAEEKERRIAERKALQEEMARRRKEAKESGVAPAKRKDIIVVSGVLVGIVLLCLLALGNSFRKAKEKQKWMPNEARGHYTNSAASPDMSGDGPKADVSEAYFTQNNHLCVKLVINNGTDRMQDIQAIDVAIYDYDTDELIAGGKAAIEDLVVEVAGTEAYTFYIAPEHIRVDETTVLPDILSFEIAIDHIPVEIE